jgi:hypothetical protein
MLEVPKCPDALELPVERSWNGRDELPALAGALRLTRTRGFLVVEACFPRREGARIPDRAPGSRVGDLYTYDVAECFLAGDDGRYLEIEIGPGGHFLVLSFESRRRRSEEHETLALDVCDAGDAWHWRQSLRVPEALLPARLRALNAFAIFGELHLAYAPLPGEAPDFHQPAAFPRARWAD